MMTPRTVPFGKLPQSDLYVDAIYEGGRRGNAGDDPFPALLSVSNQGGFRYRGNVDNLELVVLTTTLNDPDWPDTLDRETGIFTYFGDNKHPGRALHETPRSGNRILKRLFELTHSAAEERLKVAPVFLFASSGHARDVVFLGLAVPGNADIPPSEDLVAIWKTSESRRFQNYRSQFTVLDVPVVPRAWISDILNKNPHSDNAPKPWSEWIQTGFYRPLMSSRSLEYRTKTEQLPKDANGKEIVSTIHEYFLYDSYGFEKCAAAMVKLMLPGIASLDLTRPSKDGGRDATGKLRIGIGPCSILVDFALEAKCYNSSSAVGVRELSRLISRLRHRQFGILVTTSYLHIQAYKELKEDQHPILVISGRDIAELLRSNGLMDVRTMTDWLKREFPRP